MASVPTFQSNPYGSFDPSQWTNPYSNFQNQALPWPTQYAGWPTDASGRPIQPQPGMTLNSSPAAPQTAAPAAAAPNPQQWALNNDMYNAAGRNLAMGQRGGMSLGDIVDMRAQNNAAYGMKQPYGGPVLQSSGPNAAQPQAAAPAGAAANPSGLTPEQYMQLRANPGFVATPGATVPQSGSAQPSSGVLQQFLQNWNPAQSGVGSGFQQGFAKALKGMGY